MDITGFGLAAGIGLTASQAAYDGYSEAGHVSAFVEINDAVRLSLGAEQGTSKLLGQDVADITGITAEVSYQHDFSASFSVFGGVGFWQPSLSTNPVIVDEVAVTWLAGRHNIDGRPVPLESADAPYKYHGCGTAQAVSAEYYAAVEDICHGSRYDINAAPYVAIGARWEVTDWLELSVGYRLLRPVSSVEIWADGSFANPKDYSQANDGAGWWREAGPINLDTARITAAIKF